MKASIAGVFFLMMTEPPVLSVTWCTESFSCSTVAPVKSYSGNKGVCTGVGLGLTAVKSRPVATPTLLPQPNWATAASRR
jgi:hypothetical protein